MRPFFRIVVALLALLVGVLVFRAAFLPSKQLYKPPRKDALVVAAFPPEQLKIYTAHLSQAVRIKTISYDDTTMNDRQALRDFHKFLETTYPLFHKETTREIINEFSLLYSWPGKDAALKPVLMMGHFDVVPVDNEDQWTFPPFEGVVTKERVWGRGTMDDKVRLFFLLLLLGLADLFYFLLL